ncbi:MAG: choice-of-anchor V domain-containing protein [Thermoplasmata archaeon]
MLVQEKSRLVMVTVLFLIVAGSIGFLGTASQDGIWDQYEKGCTCHPFSPFIPEAQVSIPDLPLQYTPGQSYTIRVVVTGGPDPNSGGTNAQGGFNLNVSAGTLSVPPGPVYVQVNLQGNQSTHTTDGNDQRMWEIDWLAPDPGTGDVIFTVSGNSVDGDGTMLGDAWAQRVLIVPEIGPTPPPAVDLIYPDGGEDLTGGSIHDIEYEPSDFGFPNDQLLIWINYSLDGGLSFTPIPGAQGIPGTDQHPNTFAWTLPLENSTQARVNVEVKNPLRVRGSDMSASDFEIDSTPPSVLTSSPVGTDVPITTNIRVTFSEEMNQSSVQVAFSLNDTTTWTPVSGTFSWMGNETTFDPISNLQPGTEYRVNITTTATDDSDPGNSLPDLYNWTFQTTSEGDTEPPTISDLKVIPSTQEVFGSVNISAVIEDNVAVSNAWVNVTDPFGGTNESSMSYDYSSGRYYLNQSYSLLGTYNFVVWAEDSSGLRSSSPGQLQIVDTTPPSIAHIPVSLALASKTINITATVTDNYALAPTDPVWLNYTNVTETVFNITMNPIGGDDFLGQIPAQNIEGTVTYFIWANDSRGNEIMTEVNPIQIVEQDIFPPEILNVRAEPSPQELLEPVNISATIRDLSGIYAAWVVATLPGVETVNLTMIEGLNDLYYVESGFAHVGTYELVVGAEDINRMGNYSSTYTFEIQNTIPPAKPTGLSVTTPKERGELFIEWNANTEADLAGYDLYRSESEDGPYTRINKELIAGTNYTDTGLDNGTQYWYKVRAVDLGGLVSEFSDPASGTTIAPSVEADYTWVYLLIAIILILLVIFGFIAFAKRKPRAEEEVIEEEEKKTEET